MSSSAEGAAAARAAPSIDRRRFVLAGGLVLAAGPAWSGTFVYKDWRFDTDRAPAPLCDALARSLRAQVDIVDSLNLKPAIRSFFIDAPKSIAPGTPGDAGAYDLDKGQLVLGLRVEPPDDPVLLHELLHAYHHERLADGTGNPRIAIFLEEARLSGTFPPDAYMLANAVEFFAMCASVVLWGRAARPPSTRTQVRETLPIFYDWILAEFTPDGAL